MESLTLHGPQGTCITSSSGRELLNFASNDYLQLANHPDVVEAGVTGLRNNGAGVASVAFISGHHESHAELEELTSAMLQAEETILFSSCYAANVALFSALYGKDDLILSDSLNHASLIDGIRLARSSRGVFAHGDLNELRDLLADRVRYGRCAIVADTVFSMEGDYADVEGLKAIATEFECDLILDHSHLLGTEPSDGVGKFIWSSLSNSELIITGTYGKALGGAAGGFIAGSEAVIETLKQKARPYVFSNLMPPVVATIAAEAIRVMKREPWRLKRLNQNVRTFSNLANSFGIRLPVGHSHPIVPLQGSDDAAVSRAGEMLGDHDIHAVAMMYPVVPQGKARVRIQLTSGHTEEEMNRLLSIWRECI